MHILYKPDISCQEKTVWLIFPRRQRRTLPEFCDVNGVNFLNRRRAWRIVQRAVVTVIVTLTSRSLNCLSSPLILWHNKLECLALAHFHRLVHYMLIRAPQPDLIMVNAWLITSLRLTRRKLAVDKHSSLFRCSVIMRKKHFITLAPVAYVINQFSVITDVPEK